VTSKPDFKVMVLLLVFMQLTRDLFAIAKFLFMYMCEILLFVSILAHLEKTRLKQSVWQTPPDSVLSYALKPTSTSQ